MNLSEMLRLRADEIEARRIDGGPSLVMLLRDAAEVVRVAHMLNDALERSRCDELSDGTLCLECRLQGNGCLRFAAFAAFAKLRHD